MEIVRVRVTDGVSQVLFRHNRLEFLLCGFRILSVETGRICLNAFLEGLENDEFTFNSLGHIEYELPSGVNGEQKFVRFNPKRYKIEDIVRIFRYGMTAADVNMEHGQ